MQAIIQKWGNSQGLRIPRVLMESLGWSQGEKVTIEISNDQMVIKKNNRRKSITELFEGYNGAYVPEKIDWGEPVGNEIW